MARAKGETPQPGWQVIPAKLTERQVTGIQWSITLAPGRSEAWLSSRVAEELGQIENLRADAKHSLPSNEIALLGHLWDAVSSVRRRIEDLGVDLQQRLQDVGARQREDRQFDLRDIANSLAALEDGIVPLWHDAEDRKSIGAPEKVWRRDFLARIKGLYMTATDGGERDDVELVGFVRKVCEVGSVTLPRSDEDLTKLLGGRITVQESDH